MKYGTTIMVLAFINVIAMFSGIPTGWKKAVVVITAILFIGIGWILRSIAERKRERTQKVHKEIIQEEAPAYQSDNGEEADSSLTSHEAH